MYSRFPIFTIISIHALREESDIFKSKQKKSFEISIHALREESDVKCEHVVLAINGISIHALREESDPDNSRFCKPYLISIHALREESDSGV